jgi:ketosteroid isomerase-like protein
MSSVEENNKALVRRLLEEVDKGNLVVMYELLSPDFVDPLFCPDKQAIAKDTSGRRSSSGPLFPITV